MRTVATAVWDLCYSRACSLAPFPRQLNLKVANMIFTKELVCVYIYVHTHPFICVWIYVYLYIYIYIHTYIHIHILISLHIHLYIYIYIYIYIHTHTYTHTDIVARTVVMPTETIRALARQDLNFWWVEAAWRWRLIPEVGSR